MQSQAGALHCAESEKWLAAQRESHEASIRFVDLGVLGQAASSRMPIERWLQFIAWCRNLPIWPNPSTP
jgi:hypothetical protein